MSARISKLAYSNEPPSYGDMLRDKSPTSNKDENVDEFIRIWALPLNKIDLLRCNLKS
jgi:hypothetical protein